MIPKYQPTFSFADTIHLISPRNAQRRLEQDLAAAFGMRHVILFSSGRDALGALMKALGPEGEVILPAYTCIAVPDAVRWAGWRPLLADIAPGSVNMTRNEIVAACTSRTRAVIMTHQFGIPTDVEGVMELCRQRGFFVIEDAAAAFGALYNGRRVGSFGDATILSFHLTKIVNGGQCGALLTSRDDIAEAVRNQIQLEAGILTGIVDRIRAMVWGFAMQKTVYGLARHIRDWLVEDPLYERIESMSAPVACRAGCSAYVADLIRRQMPALAQNLRRRGDLAQIYALGLKDLNKVRLCSVPAEGIPAWMQYPILVDDKAACYRYFLKKSIDLSWTFRYCCLDTYPGGEAPNAMLAARNLLGLPTYPSLKDSDAYRICELFHDFFKRGGI